MGAIASRVASETRSPSAQRVIATLPDTRESLASNAALSDEVFAMLYKNARIPASLAKDLIGVNIPTQAQFEHVLAVETRSTILLALLEHGLPPQDRLDLLLEAKGFSRQVADKVVDSFNPALPTPWVRAAADKVAGRALLELWLREPGSVTDAEIGERLACYTTWGPKPDQDRLTRLIAAHPGAIGGAARSDSPKVRTWAAGSRHLTDEADQIAVLDLDDVPQSTRPPAAWVDERMYTLLAFVNNPVVPNAMVTRAGSLLAYLSDYSKSASASDRLKRHPVPATKTFECEDDPVVLSWLLQRTLPRQESTYGEYPANPGRPWDLAALLANPHLSAEHVLFASKRLADMYHAPEIVAAYDTQLERFPSLVSDYGLQPLKPWPTEGAIPMVPVVRRVAVSDDCWAESIDRAAGTPVDHMKYSSGGTMPFRYLDRELGDDDAAWLFALRLAETFSGTMADLVTVTKASAA